MWWFVPKTEENLTEEQKQKLFKQAHLCNLASMLMLVPAILLTVFSVVTKLAELSIGLKIAVAVGLVLLFGACIALLWISYGKLKKAVGYQKPIKKNKKAKTEDSAETDSEENSLQN